MSEFTFLCPSCRVDITADDSECGSQASCPGCSAELTVPERSEYGTAATGIDGVLRQPARPDEIPVSSGDIGGHYDVVGMVCFTAGTRGGMAAEFQRLKEALAFKFDGMRKKGQLSASRGVGQFIGGIGVGGDGDIGLAGQFAGASFRSDDTEIAFLIAVTQLQVRAHRLGANAIVGFRYDLDFDSHANVLNFIATGYGTAVRLRNGSPGE